MAKRDVLTYPNPVLRKACQPVPDLDDEFIRIARDMAETMYVGRGIGLAAPQIGIAKRLIVLDIGEGLVTLFNPEIVLAEGTSTMEEGCLCLPNIAVDVERKACVRVSGIDLKGNPVALDAEDLLATVLQHETDHLKGTLIIDRISKVKRDMVMRKYRKLNQKAGK